MTATTQREPMHPSRKGLHLGLWIVQGLLALTFVGGGLWKVATPVPELASKMPWMGQVSPSFLYTTAVIDILGGLGLVLPSITRIKPGLTVLAALGCVALQGCAIVFHVSRGEAANTPFNFVLIALALFVAWGRRTQAPIQPRG
ncbi:MAG: DoxX family protein [Polyangiaceae bacterium]|jgi:DoxX-like protein